MPATQVNGPLLRRITAPGSPNNGSNTPANTAVSDTEDIASQSGAPPAQPPAAPTNGAPPSTNDLKVRFKVRNLEGVSIVKLASSATVQDAFAAASKRFARKLEGAGVQALRFAFPDEVLDVELDDADTWEDVLAKLAHSSAEGTLNAVEGVIEV